MKNFLFYLPIFYFVFLAVGLFQIQSEPGSQISSRASLDQSNWPILPLLSGSEEPVGVLYKMTGSTSNLIVNCTHPDKPTLVALYESTDGDNWTNSWDTTNCDVCNWYGVTCDGNDRVVQLILANNQLSGSIPMELGNLSNLTVLYLNNNQLSGCLPQNLQNLCGNTTVDISNNSQLYTQSWLDYCNNQVGMCCSSPVHPDYESLMALYYSTNGPTWTINSGWVDGSTASSCDPCNFNGGTWYGITCDGNGRVTHIDLDGYTDIGVISNNGNNLNGVLPSEINQLSELKGLYLTKNSITGAVPPEIGALSNLQHLYLRENQFTEIPPEIGNLQSLEYLIAGNNQLSGAIPPEIGNMNSLQHLFLMNNNLSGNIPPEIGNLTSLVLLYLSNNQLSGTIPSDLGNLTNLKDLSLSQNQLTGSIPVEISSISQLRNLSLGHNQLTGSIPIEIGQLTQLKNIWLQDNQLTGAIPSELGSLSNLVRLYLDRNNLSDTIPSEIGYLSNLWILWLYGNQLTGEIPNELGNISGLLQMSLFDNQLSGSIPQELGNLSNLNTLLLQDNQLAGCIPQNLQNICSTVNNGNISNNPQLYTQSWSDFCNNQAGMCCTHPDKPALVALYESTDGDNWTNSWDTTNCDVCNWYGVTCDGNDRVIELYMYNNNLSGNLTGEIGDLTYLRRLYLPNNQLTGVIPDEIGSLSDMSSGIFLHSNQLSGVIPNSLGNLTNLPALSLSYNNLSGPIPGELGNLSNLNSLQLHSNQLSGCLPQNLQNLCGNTTVDISNNPQLYTQSWSDFCTNQAGMCCTHPDKPALVALYESTDGDNWTNSWDTTNCDVCNWYGVSCDGNDRVIGVDLLTNNLSGTLPVEIEELTYLEELRLQGNQITGSIPSEYGNLSNLELLLLDNNQLSGAIPPELGLLSNLTNFNLHNNQLTGNIPSELGDLSSLVVLSFYNNQLSGSIPPELGNLSNLTLLFLFLNQFTGSIPVEISNLSALQFLQLQNNQLSGNIPPEMGDLTNLNTLYLSDNQLTGNIPPELGNLTNLVGLHLHDNQLTGAIPAELGNLSNIKALHLNNNQLTSSLPPELGNINLLEELKLNDNQFTDEIPSELGNLSNLYLFHLQNNQLLGCIPPELKNICGNVTDGDISNNPQLFTQSWTDFCNNQAIHPDKEALVALYESTDGDNWINSWDTTNCDVCNWYGVTCDGNDRVIELDLSGNSLSGSLPPELGNLPNLQLLYLNNNQLNGSIPVELGNLLNLYDLALYNNQLSGSIPDEIGNLTNLEYLTIYNNQLSGSIPDGIGNLLNLYDLFLYNNQLSGSIPDEIGNLSNLEYLVIFNNQLSGSIPDGIGNLSNLQFLDLYNNQLSGSIPDEIGNLSNLSLFQLQNNQLSGCLSQNLQNLCGNTTVNISNNPQLYTQSWTDFCNNQTGMCCTHPDKPALVALYESTDGDNWINSWDTTNCDVCNWYGVTCDGNDRVIELDLSGNSLSGSLPPELGNLPNLQLLYLNNNQLSGSIPVELGNLLNLYDLALYNNQLSGSIPNEIGNLSNLQFLDLYNNQLSGSIPDGIGNLLNLYDLFLYNNQLSGSIPDEIGNLSNLEYLVIFNNQLSGSIPDGIGNLSNLQFLDLYNNQLSGSIPDEIGNLSNLSLFQLQNNQLSGCLPQNLQNLCGNTTVNISNNPQLYTQSWSDFCNNQAGICCPDYILTLSTSSTTICPDSSVTITFGDNSNYSDPPYILEYSANGNTQTINNVSTLPHDVVFTPSANTIYTFLSLEDASGCVDMDPQPNVTIEVSDNDPPIAVCQDVTVQLDANGEGSITANEVDNGSSDNCGIANMSLDQTNFGCSEVGANSVTLTVTDVNGNSSSCSSTVTVEDNVLPVAVCQDVTVQLDANGEGSLTASQVDNGSSDNCGIASMSLDETDFDCSEMGANTVILTVTDVNGNSSSCSSTVTVENNVLPVAVCQDVTVQLDANGEGSITASQVDNGSSDNCGIASLSLDQTDFNCSEVGANTVTLTVTDVNGNSSTCSSTVMVEDNILPVAVCQDVTVQLDANGEGSITASQVDNGSSDNCGIASMSLDETEFDCSEVGMNTVVLTVTDVNGNSNTCSSTVTVEDNILPIAECQDVTVQLDANGGGSITASQIDNGSSDNCGIASLSLSETNYDCSEVGANTVTLTVTDVNGNSSTCSATITVEDNILPIAECQDVTVQLDANGEGSITANEVNNGSSDNCGIDNLSLDQTEFDCSEVGMNTVVLTVTDVNGNSSSCSSTVTVEDNIAPQVISTPADIIINCDDPLPTDEPTAEDNCGVIITFEDEVIPGSCIGESIIRRTFTISDPSGNESTIKPVREIQLIDNEVPNLISAPSSDTIECGTTPPLTLPEVNDNCDPDPEITYTDNYMADPNCPQGGRIDRTFTISDDCGNSYTLLQQFFFIDIVNPVINPLHPDLIGLPHGGTLQYQCFAQDPDWQYPVFNADDFDITDNCSNDILITVEDEVISNGNCLADGYLVKIMYTVTANDQCGNIETYEFYVEIIDEIAPQISGIPSDLTLNCDNDYSYPVVGDCLSPADVTATDECECPSILETRDTIPGNCPNEYSVHVTYMATDNCGNSSSASFVITIEDQSSLNYMSNIPQLEGLGNGAALEINCVDGNYPAWVNTIGANTMNAVDNCGDAILLNYNNSSHGYTNCFEAGALGYRDYSWTFQDECGNVSTYRIRLILVDTVAPVIHLENEISCSGNSVLNPIVTDNCGTTESLSYEDHRLFDNCSGKMYIERTWIATDYCGNVSTDMQFIIEKPVMEYNFREPLNNNIVDGDTVTMECSEIADLNPSNDWLVLEEGCFGSGEVLKTIVVEGTEDKNCENGILRTDTWTWHVENVCGESEEIEIFVQVTDQIAPYLLDFEDEITILCGQDRPEYAAKDACSDDAEAVEVNFELIDGDTCSGRLFERELLTYDHCGNERMYTQTVIVNGATGPEIIGIPGEAVCDANDLNNVQAFDHCATKQVSVSYQDIATERCGNALRTLRVYSATSKCGTESKDSVYIIQEDDISPSYEIVGEELENLSDGSIVEMECQGLNELNNLNINKSDIHFSDDCDLDPKVDFNDQIVNENCTEDGYIKARIFTWSGTDVCGNQTQVQIEFRLVDIEAPEFLVIPGDITLLCEDEYEFDDPIASDDCHQRVEVTFEDSQPQNIPEGTLILRTWTASDGCGNSTSVEQRIVYDSGDLQCHILVPPIIECNERSVEINSNVLGGLGPYNYDWQISGGVSNIVAGQGTPSINLDIGFSTTEVTLVVEDQNGCITSCVANINCGFESRDPLREREHIEYALYQNIPNPFNEHSVIGFRLPAEGKAILKIYNNSGTVIEEIKDTFDKGYNEIQIRSSNFPSSGLYYYELSSGKFNAVKRMIMVD